MMQGFDPCGVFARDLRECLTLQLKEQDRCDPAMAAFIENLHLLADTRPRGVEARRGVLPTRIWPTWCRGEAAKSQARSRNIGSTPAQPIVPDVLLRALPDGSYHVELNI